MILLFLLAVLFSLYKKLKIFKARSILISIRGKACFFILQEIADPRYAVQKALVVYYNSLETARKDPRAGRNPYIAYAAGLRGTKRSDLVVHDQDLLAILGSPSGPQGSASV